jgi:Ran GTPase-activating protein (RanGAP) involved in mRNA processing and transport
LKQNTSLTTIDLDGNNIQVGGAIAIADALKENTSLKSINLIYNHIQDKESILIADALKENLNLTSIKLNLNRITADGAVVMVDVLKKIPVCHALILFCVMVEIQLRLLKQRIVLQWNELSSFKLTVDVFNFT